MRTAKEAAKKLPKFAKGLYNKNTHFTAEDVREMVRQELRGYQLGQNPLEPSQVKALKEFLVKTAR